MPSSDISVTPITEAQAEREVRNAKRALQRARLKLNDTKWLWPNGAAWHRAYGVTLRAEARFDAAERRLEAVRSQQPERHQGAWSS